MSRVLVCGFFDMLHSGYLEFLREASSFGELYVSVGSDRNHNLLKGALPVHDEHERVALVGSLKTVEEAFLSTGEGKLDFIKGIERVRPDMVVVNMDGHSPDKQRAVEKLGVEYRILDAGATVGDDEGSSDDGDPLRVQYRLCLAGGWMDQPWMSQIRAGSVVVVGLQPTMRFMERAGMATSTRNTARRIWGERIPSGDDQTVAKILFGAENPPGTKYVSGSQDSIGLVYPGVSRLHYEGGYWPSEISSVIDPGVAAWLEDVIHMVPIGPRPDAYDPLVEQNLDGQIVRQLGESGDACYNAILKRDVVALGQSVSKTLETWKALLPMTVPPRVAERLKEFDSSYGCTISGCGGGYAVVISDKPVADARRIKVRMV